MTGKGTDQWMGAEGISQPPGEDWGCWQRGRVHALRGKDLRAEDSHEKEGGGALGLGMGMVAL